MPGTSQLSRAIVHSHGKSRLTNPRATLVRSHAQNHYLRGFDERRSAVAWLQAQLFCGIGGDDGGDVLFADGQRHLGEQPAELQSDDAADQLIASANFPEM